MIKVTNVITNISDEWRRIILTLLALTLLQAHGSEGQFLNLLLIQLSGNYISQHRSVRDLFTSLGLYTFYYKL